MGSKTGITAESILESELYGVLIKGRGENDPLSPAAILTEIRAAEDSIEHDIKVAFGEQRIVCEPEARGIAASAYDREEAAYDFERDMFLEHRWGYFELRARPVIAIERLFFRFPGGSFSTPYTILPEWIRLEKTFGHLRIVPTHAGPELSMLAIGAFLMSMLRGGGTRGVPHALYVDYRAGLTRDALCRHHQDLLKAVRIRATLLLMGILSNVRGAGVGSQSLSQDGQSRSQSLASGKWGPYSGAIEIAMRNESALLDAWRSSEKGPLFAVV